jgi:ubiquinone/menaquinone biosynthesis C-methylase UbiE
VRRYPFAPAWVFTSFLVATAIDRGMHRPEVISTSILLACVVSAVAFGYSLRALGRSAHLHELRRTQYAEVWDSLAETHSKAAHVAAGMQDESSLRRTGTQVANRCAEAVSLRPTDDVLEIGCGVGRVGWAIAPRCHTWTGCDISQKMLDAAGRRLAEYRNVSFLLLDGRGLRGVPDSSMDFVYCTNMLPHIDHSDRWIYVSESFRALRPGGRFYLDSIALESPEGWEMLLNNVRQLSHGVESPYRPIPSTSDELLAYLTHAGFHGIQVHVSGGLLIAIGTKPQTAE